MRGLAVLLLVTAACGADHHDVPVDTGIPDAAPPPDGNNFPACADFSGVGADVPVHILGAVSGADLEAPATCDVVDAPFGGGTESAGPESVFPINGLVVGTTYVVSLTSASDLNFYVVTGCSTPTGPASAQCLVFEDAQTAGTELATFVAAATTMYVVVDYFASIAPADPTFTLDVYREQCHDSTQCGGATPACTQGHCVECVSSFDCASAEAPRCDAVSHSCQAGVDACTTDDPAEPGDDGPAGARMLVLDGGGHAQAAASVCSTPTSEADFYAFDVLSLGERWTLSLAWGGSRDLDLELYDARGTLLGMSFWEQPETVKLTYLAVGRYYAKVTEFSSSPDPTAVPYTISAQRTLGAPCGSASDCAVEYRNQLFRGSCTAGACVPIESAGTTAEGGSCDAQSDCAAGLSCPSFYFVAGADTRDTCARSCAGDGDCAPLGTDYVCTTYLDANFCVQKCTTDVECPIATELPPIIGPWFRLTCDVPTGRCQ